MTALKPKDITLIRRILLAISVCALAGFVIITARWHIMWDTQVMHYVDLLVAHGFAPYRTIGDMNMPGAYWVEHFGIAVFGASDFSWRMYEFFLLTLLGAGMTLIARPYDRLAGFLAFTLFIVLHGIDDASNAVQRDEVMTIALILATAALFRAVRVNSSLYGLVSGLFFGFATAIKPTAIVLGVALLVGASVVQKKRNASAVKLLASGVCGVPLIGAAVLLYLHHFQALGSFLFILRKVLPAYAPMDSFSLSWLLSFALTPVGWLLLPLAVVAALILNKAKEPAFGDGLIARWEQAALIVAFFFGLGSYLLQHKGYAYHRYPALAFGLLWACIVLLRAIASSRRYAILAGLFAVMFIVVMVVPLSLAAISQLPARDPFSEQLASDLRTLGPSELQHQVQCLDVVFGCLNALYHAGIVQNYGATGDLLYFQPRTTPVVEHYREAFWQHLQSDPPAAFILSNQWFGEHHSFDKVSAWPEFQSFLQTNYVSVVERSFPSHSASPSDDRHIRRYRIYLRRDSSLLGNAARLRP